MTVPYTDSAGRIYARKKLMEEDEVKQIFIWNTRVGELSLIVVQTLKGK